jgi:predicted metalloprotease
MRWTPGGVSEDIEDQRGGGGIRLGGFSGRGLGLGGTLLLLVLSVVFRQDFFSLLSGDPAPAGPASSAAPRNDREVQFVSFVLDDVQRNWDRQLAEQARKQYRHARLVLFEDYTGSGCGAADSATGPFYCPADQKVYIDLRFFDELRSRFGAPGEFAQAYVIAHEIGHHLQNLLGIHDAAARDRQANPGAANRVSVAVELQADCLAGVWGHSTEQRNIVDKADIADGMRAAAAVGDDRMQRMARGRVSPESFTHGSSEQRVAAFKRGFDSGSLSACMGSR